MSETQNVFDVIGTYFINVYWFELYKYAIDAFTQQKFPTQEDAYKNTMDRYCNAFTRKPQPHEKANAHYDKIVRDIHKRFQHWFKMPNLSLAGFVDTVTRQLIPKEFYSQLGRQDQNKNIVFNRAMTRALTEFTVYIASEGAKDVLYGRGQGARQYMRQWKLKFIELLFKERDTLYSHFMASKNGVDIDKPTDSINRKALEIMQDQIKKLIHEKAKLQNTIMSYEDAVDKYKQLVGQLRAQNNVLRQGAVAPMAVADPNPGWGTPVTTLGDDDEDGSFESEESSSSGSIVQVHKPVPAPAVTGLVDTPAVQVDHDVMADVMKPMNALEEFSGEDFIEEDDLGSNLSDEVMVADE